MVNTVIVEDERPSLERLKDIEAQTDPARFVRISKSAIVAVDKIEKLSRWFQSSHLVTMSDDKRTKLKTGRTYLPALREKLLFQSVSEKKGMRYFEE